MPRYKIINERMFTFVPVNITVIMRHTEFAAIDETLWNFYFSYNYDLKYIWKTNLEIMGS